MKKAALLIVFGLFFIPLFAQQTQLGLPGDDLNLYAVLNIFQKSPTLEDFEKTLNAEDSKINNLDLNGDGQIDYIHVIDNANGSIHDIVLRVDINEHETQDVAVIEVERDANNQVHVQIIGDEALYGKDYIVEPYHSTPNPGYQGNVQETAGYYPPESWSIVGYMYAPTYVVWHSPFYWGYYPHFWHPWHPVEYHVYYGYHPHYYHYYRRSYTYRSPEAHAYYAPHRVTSEYVHQKYPGPRPLPGNHQENTNVRPVTPEHRQTEKLNPTPNNQTGTHEIHQVQNRNNPPTEKIHQTPNNQGNQVHQVNQSPQHQGNQVHQVNQSPQHQGNNQVRKMNTTPQHQNNQVKTVKQAPHEATHKVEPEKK